jgi:hypothetical protein
MQFDVGNALISVNMSQQDTLMKEIEQRLIRYGVPLSLWSARFCDSGRQFYRLAGQIGREAFGIAAWGRSDPAGYADSGAARGASGIPREHGTRPVCRGKYYDCGYSQV